MGLLDRLMFWRNDHNDGESEIEEIEPVDGYTVDGCFTLPAEPSASSGPSTQCEEPGQRLPVDEAQMLDGSGHGDVEVP